MHVQARLLADLARAPLPQLLNRMDKSLMAGSVEARVPFLDPEVVALALNLPPRARRARWPRASCATSAPGCWAAAWRAGPSMRVWAPARG